MNTSMRFSTLSVLVGLIISVTLVAVSVVVVFFTYIELKRDAEASVRLLETSIQQSSLPYEMFSGNIGSVKKIVDERIKHAAIFAIEVSTEGGDIIYRNEKEDKKVSLEKRIAPIKDIRDTVPQDDYFGGNDVDNYSNLGYVTLYINADYVFETIKPKLIFIGSIQVLTPVFLVLIFLRYIISMRRFISSVNQKIGFIERGELADSDSTSKIVEFEKTLKSLTSLSYKLIEHENELRSSRDSALEAEKFKDEFIRSVSHELRHPLNEVVIMLYGISNDIHSYELDFILEKRIGITYAAVHRIRDIVEEMFDFEQFEKEKFDDKKLVVDLESYFNSFKSLYADRAAKETISYDVQCLNESSNLGSGAVRVDYKKLTRILTNLIENAIKFTIRGEVIVSWSLEQDNLMISVKDSGIGIPEDKYERIFEKHIKLANSATGNISGRGAGLFYVKTLADVIGAAIDVDSKLNFGSEFTLNVPVERCEKMDISISSDLAESLSTLSVVVIDDCEDTCFAIEQLLETFKIQCETETRFKEGYELIHECKPDLVFVDFHLDGLDGAQLVSMAQAANPENATFFVCFTADVEKVRPKDYGDCFNERISKPLSEFRLIEILKSAVKAKEYRKTVNWPSDD